MYFAFLTGTEMIFVLVIVVVLFGASRLPQLGKALGDGIFQFRNAIDQSRQDDKKLPEKPEASKEPNK